MQLKTTKKLKSVSRLFNIIIERFHQMQGPIEKFETVGTLCVCVCVCYKYICILYTISEL